MTITNQDVRIYRGDSHVLHVEIVQADGTPYNPSLGAGRAIRRTEVSMIGTEGKQPC